MGAVTNFALAMRMPQRRAHAVGVIERTDGVGTARKRAPLPTLHFNYCCTITFVPTGTRS